MIVTGERYQPNSDIGVGLVTAAVMVGWPRLTLTVREAGVASVLPAASVARTSKTYVPSVSPENVLDAPAHVSHADCWAPESRHSNVAGVSLDANPKVAEPVAVVAAGPLVTVVSGAAVSTVNSNHVGSDSLPAVSTATTVKR